MTEPARPAAPADPPRLAVRLLHRSLPPGERDAVVGDLLELFDSRRRLKRTWFWGQAILFAVTAAGLRVTAVSSTTRGSIMRRGVSGFLQALRRLRHDGRYAASVACILAIGIGPAAAMLSVVTRVLLRPLDYVEPERLALLRVDLGQLRGHPGLSPAEAIDMRASGLFENVEAQMRLAEVSLGPPHQLVSLSLLTITTGMRPMLGVGPVMGRVFTEDDMPAGPAAATAPTRILIDYTTWQTHFGSDRSVIGRLVQINGRAAEIIGVLPPGFRLATGRAVPQRVDVYMPLRLRDMRNAWQFPTLARLKRGTTVAQVQAGLDALSANLKRAYPEFYDGELRFTVTPLLADMTRTIRPALRAATAAVLLLLLIAFANATALVVARLRARESEFAIRTAIGATPGMLATEVLLECGALAAAGAVIGGALAAATVVGIRAIIPRTVPRWEGIGIGWDVITFAAALALAGLVIAGLLSVAQILRAAPQSALRSGSVQGGGNPRATSRLLLVGGQIALTVALAFGCVQLLRSAAHLRRVDLGFDPAVATFRVPYDFQRYRTPGARAELYQRIRDRVRQVPGVTDVGIVTHLPLSGATMMDGYQADLSREVSFEQSANYQAVTPGYFAALRIPIVEGRDFTDVEDATSQPVVVVDQTLARTVFPGERQVVGRMLRLGWGLPNSRIVGVVGHVRSIDVGREVRPQIYTPMGNLFQQSGSVCVRAQGHPLALSAAITAAINDAGPGRAVSHVAMLSDNVQAATSALVSVTTLVTALAASAGLLSAAGLYLVVSFLVFQRRRMTAIRSALGASRRQVMWVHYRTTVLVMAVALPLGVLLAALGGHLLSDLAYGVATRDLLSLGSALAVATVAGLLGTYVPVRRAVNTNIVQVLRES